ncbi:MAG: thymidine phosphorylase family protein [Alphaproteobacteria bacterium]|nr:thymidine phosphorylase family protein [Alphaproteobacteria bacterium]
MTAKSGTKPRAETGAGARAQARALADGHNELKARRMGIETLHEAHVFLRADSHVCRSEGFASQNSVLVTYQGHSIVATLYVVGPELLGEREIGLSEYPWAHLELKPGSIVSVSHPPPLESFSHVRSKVYGHKLSDRAFKDIIEDIVAGRYQNIDLSAFITTCAANSLDLEEMIGLTRAMVDVGEHIDWQRSPIVDKHCVGGLPGNRTSPLVVSIVAAAGVWIPKTSSRAITSPAGTADAMETLTNVDLDLPTMRRVVERENGCIVWGQSVGLSPVDDVLIRVERALDIDSDAQLVASVLSKKVAAGSSHVVIDIPVGPTAKVRSMNAAERLEHLLERVGRQVGLRIQAVVTDGTQPIGHGMGPALEARDVVAVASGAPGAPADLRKRSIRLAGELLEMVGACAHDEGQATAAAILDDGRAWKKLQAICEAQGGMRTPPVAEYRHDVPAPRAGQVVAIDNRLLARIAKLAGAPASPASGIDLHVRLGALVHAGQPLFTIHGQTPGELSYARDYLLGHPGVVTIGEAP